MKVFKLTNTRGQTHRATQWGRNITHNAPSKCPELCSNGWIHFYTDPILAVLMNPIHGNFRPPLLWEADTLNSEMKLECLKGGARTLRTDNCIPLPDITLQQKVAFGILCVLKVCQEPDFKSWASRWLDDADRGWTAAAEIKNAYFTSTVVSFVAHAAITASPSVYGAAFTKIIADAHAAIVATSVATAAFHTVEADPAIDFVAIAHEALIYK